MNSKQELQTISSKSVKDSAVIVPIDLWKRLLMIQGVQGTITAWEEGQISNDVIEGYPKEVIAIMTETGCTIQKAWRLYRKMSLKEVGELVGVKYNSISLTEKRKRIHKATAEKLAVIYNCKVEQLYFD